MEQNKQLLENLKKVSPGTALRTVINDLVHAGLGALIVFETPEIEKIVDGGFRINCRFTSQRLFELCKMDGAIVISSDQKKIQYANILLTPDNAIITRETGTRHKAAERTAKQFNTLVIAVSERKKKTTLYLGTIKYVIRPAEEVLREIVNTLLVLEKQRELFDSLLLKLDILEINNLVSVGDVSKLIQKAEIIKNYSEILKKDFIEAGKEGNLMNLRFKELTKGIEKKEEDILRDYSSLALKKTKRILENLSFEGLLETESFSNLLFEKNLGDAIMPRGFRLLSRMNLTEREISQIVETYNNLPELLNDETNKLEILMGNRSQQIKEKLIELKEEIIEGRTTN